MEAQKLKIKKYTGHMDMDIMSSIYVEKPLFMAESS